MKPLPKIRLYIDLDAICHNYREIKKKAGGARVISVIKADAYGHGAIAVAESLVKEGCDYFGVSCFGEAKQLRDAGILADILILGYTEPEFARDAVDMGISQAVFDLQTAKKYSAAAIEANGRMKIHIKLNTGMNRIGLNCAKDSLPIDEIKSIAALRGLELEGIFTHFAEADNPSSDFTSEQFEIFKNALDRLEGEGIRPKIRHAANSGAILNYPETALDAVRPGIILYGLMPSANCENSLNLKPAMSLETIVVRCDHIKKGEGIGYGRTCFLPEDAYISTLAAGYADGYPRGLSNNCEVFINGKRAKIRGVICMDMCMAEVRAEVGDTATLFGPANGCDITLDELAEKLSTINYELACHVGKRVLRIYCKDGGESFRV